MSPGTGRGLWDMFLTLMGGSREGRGAVCSAPSVSWNQRLSPRWFSRIGRNTRLNISPPFPALFTSSLRVPSLLLPSPRLSCPAESQRQAPTSAAFGAPSLPKALLNGAAFVPPSCRILRDRQQVLALQTPSCQSPG